MNSEPEKPPEINPAFKASFGSVISNPIPDDEYLTLASNKKLKLILICIIIDFLVIVLMLLQEYEFLISIDNMRLIQFILRCVLCLICFSSLILFFCLHKIISAKIAKWSYLILGIVYYGIILVFRIINLVEICLSDEDKTLSIVFFILFLGTIAPRIIVFFLSKKYIEKLEKLLQIKMLDEQEKFVERIATRIEKGYRRWSNPSISYDEEDNVLEDNKNKYLFDKKENIINNGSTDDNESEKIDLTISSNININ